MTGMPASAGAAIAERHAGHDLVRDAGGLERERFFAAAAEHERIAALQPHDALAAARGADHERDGSSPARIEWRPARLPT